MEDVCGKNNKDKKAGRKSKWNKEEDQ